MKSKENHRSHIRKKHCLKSWKPVEKNMKKKVVALMTIATMAASLFAGCGEQTQNVGGGTETGNQAASGEKETMNIHLKWN